MGEVEGLARSLASQAIVLRKMGRKQEAVPLAEEAHQLTVSHGYTALARPIEPFLNTVRQAAQGE